MTTEELNRLLAKYYSGESSEEEESLLRSFFNGDNIPEGFEAEKKIFGYYLNAVEVPEPSPDFETRILADIDEHENKNRSQKLRKFILPIISTAAGLLIIAGSYFFFINRNEPRDTYSDPKIAYAETIKILTEVSSKMNRGTRTLEPVSKINEVTTKSFAAFNKSTNIVEKNLKNLDYLQKAFDITIAPVTKSINN
jgi:hypothetical protein